MTWTDFFIKNPIFSVSLFLLLAVFGAYSYFQLEVRLYPKMESSVIQITVDYPGASALTMKNFVTRRIFDALNNLDSLDYISASNTVGQSSISLHFKIGTPMHNALNRILGKMMSLRADLPKGIQEPSLSIVDSNDNPDELLAFEASNMKAEEIADYLTRIIKPRLDAIAGLSSVLVLGPRPALRIKLKAEKMMAYGLQVSDIISAIQAQNRLSVSGALEGRDSEWRVPIRMSLSSVWNFNSIIVKNRFPDFVPLSEVADISWGPETDKIRTFYGENPAAFLSLKIASPNALGVFTAVKRVLMSAKESFPAGLSVHELVNGGNYIKSVLHEMLKTLCTSLFIVLLLSLIFFSNLRSALIIMINIPISLLGTGILLWIFSASINSFSLLAMIIVMGLLVDDAIVLTENCTRYMEEGYSVLEAAYRATREIAFPFISMTLSLAALFLPIAFLNGVIGKLFFEFFLTLLGSVMISALVALTLLPMLCSRFLKKSSLKTRFPIQLPYLKILKILFEHKKKVLLLWLMMGSFGLYAYATRPMDFAPKEDAKLLEVINQAPNSSNTHFLNARANEFSKINQSYSEIKSYSRILGVPSEHQFLSFIRLYSGKGETREIQASLQSEMNKNPNLNAVAIMPAFMPGSQGMPLEFVLTSQDDYRDLYTLSSRIMDNARKSGLFLFLDRDLHYDQPSLELHIDRDAAAFLKVSLKNIEQAISNFLGENTLQYLSRQGELYPLILESDEKLKESPRFLNDIYVKSEMGKLIPLSALVFSRKSISPERLNQFQKQNSLTISAIMRSSYSLSQGIQFFKKQANHILPASVSSDFSGNARALMREGKQMNWIFLLAFFVIFIVLAMQFSSFVDPFIILLGSLPAAIFGAMLPFCLGLAKMNIYTPIAFLVLSGLVSKHGVLITQFANTLCKANYSRREAVFEAILIRFRPILMTSLAIILGALPLLFSKGPGYEARFSLGIVLVCGMTVGSLFSLWLLPILYFIFHIKTKTEKNLCCL